MGELQDSSNLPQNCDFTVRAAKKNDLDDMTQIHVDAFAEEALEQYMYPLRKQYPEDYWKWTRKEYESFLEQPQKFVVHILETPYAAPDGSIDVKPVGFAVWDIAVLLDSVVADQGLQGLHGRRDANQKHCEVFSEAGEKRFQTYFAKWGAEQIDLSALVVHPDFQRRGAGTMLASWGIKIAGEKGRPVTLCATVMGQTLYERLKFERIATEVIRVDGEEEAITGAVMVHAPGKRS